VGGIGKQTGKRERERGKAAWLLTEKGERKTQGPCFKI